jgi:signal transduction histidine kinase
VILLEKEFDNKRLNVEMDEDTILKIKGNPELMEHVWINLLTNAIKHSPGSSTIYIRSGAEAIKVLGLEGYDSSSVITITDCGHGMDEETLEHIFDKYYQKDKFSPGNGIGLSIVKRIVELNNGEVKVKSKLNEGTTFAVIM